MTFFENKFPAIFLLPLSWLYSIIIIIRNLLYDFKLLQITKVDCPVICVGNLTVGGTGKTPTVLFLANWFQEKGKRVCVVSRGYGRQSTGLVVVSDGQNILAPVELSGDEPFLLAQKNPKAIIIVDEKRANAAQYAVDHFQPDVVIMDDGFQHRSLYRDMNVMTINGTKKFGNNFVLPAGPLREPLFYKKRADIIWVNDSKNYNMVWKQPIVKTEWQFEEIVQLHRSVQTSGQRVIAFSGIGNPTSFYDSLKNKELKVLHFISFPDHHAYSKNDIEKLLEIYKKFNADFILTTEKDWVKIKDFGLDEKWGYLPGKLVISKGCDLEQLFHPIL